MALALGVGLLVAGGAWFAFRSKSPTKKYHVVVVNPPARFPRHHRPRNPGQQQRALSRLVKLGYPIYCAGGRKRAVALTFDDGPGGYTPDALRMLRRAGARATFFLVGKELRWFPGFPRKEARLAALGDHTWSHSYLPRLSARAVWSELVRTKQAIVRASGAQVLLYRPPYGGRSPAASAVARKLGLVEVLWSADSADSAGAVPRQILANVTAGLHPGAIILMHENRGQTIKALEGILRSAKRRHLRAVTLPELLTADPPSVKQLRLGVAGCLRRV